jgi:hypothetical protein
MHSCCPAAFAQVAGVQQDQGDGSLLTSTAAAPFPGAFVMALALPCSGRAGFSIAAP